MTATEQDIKDAKSSLTDLTKIPEKEFEKEFRDWMERDGVARALQSKLRCDLIANFNKTSLGKRLMAETTNRLTLSSTVLALNTLVAEFLYAQDCHFTLSVFCTEVPFRNALPDFDNERHFRFKETEIFDIMKAICNTTTIDWNTKNKLVKNYNSDVTASLLYHIIQILLEKNAENMQRKKNVATNTRAESIVMENKPNTGEQSIKRDENAELYNTNFRYLNKYLIILSKKVNEMTKHFERPESDRRQPRIRLLKSARHRKYEDLNRSLERVTANLKQMASAKRKSKHVNAIVQAIERLASQFQRCAANFDRVSTNFGSSAKQKTATRATQVETSSTISGESFEPKKRPHMFAASQTEAAEKSYSDWLHEMRYTRNGQKFLDRVEKSLRKAMDNQKRELLLENDVRMRHQCELLKIRYKQKLLEHMYMNSGENVETADENQELQVSISEQFRQFELKHFNLLSKIYETEIENKPAASTEAKPDASTARTMPSYLQVDESRACIDVNPSDLKAIPPSELFEQQQQNSVLPQSSLNIRQHIREAVDEMAEEERNVNKIVHDAKMRIKDLEQESDQITDNFLEYLERQRKQRLDARDAAQNLWNDYLNESENMNLIYANSNCSEVEKSKILENLKKQILYNNPAPSNDENIETQMRRPNKSDSNTGSNSSSSHSTAYYRHKNPISKAKDDFFERERIFKQESERILCQQQDATMILASDDITNTTAGNKIDMPFELCIHEPTKLSFPAGTKKLKASLSNSIMIAQLLNDSYNDGGGGGGGCGGGSDFNMLYKTTSRSTTKASRTKVAMSEECNSSNSPEIQSGIGDRYKKIETPRTLSALTTSKKQISNITIPAAAAATTTTTTTRSAAAMATTSSAFLTTNTTATTVNKSNNNNGEGRSCFGVSFVEAPRETSLQNDCNTKSDIGQNNAQQSERNNSNSHKSYWRNDNNNNNNNNKGNKTNSRNNKRNGSTESNEEVSSKNSIRNESATRKFLLQQSMARMQQLFSPHHPQEQQEQQQQPEQLQQQYHRQQKNRKQQQHPQAMFDDYVFDDDVGAVRNETSSQETMQKSNKPSTIEENQRSSNNRITKVFAANSGSENVLSHYKNNFKLLGTTEEVQQRQQQTMPNMGSIDNDDAITDATTMRAQQNGATKTSSNNGNKAIEVRRDWQQIGYGTSGRRSSLKVNEKADAKVTSKVIEASASEGRTFVVNEEMNVDCNVAEFGEIIEDDSSSILAAAGTSPYAELRAQQKREIGKLIESGDDAAVLASGPAAGDAAGAGAAPAAAAGVAGSAANGNNFTSISLQSSTSTSSELQFSHVGGAAGVSGFRGGGGGGGDAGSLPTKGVGSGNALLEVGSGSDSNSDFWA